MCGSEVWMAMHPLNSVDPVPPPDCCANHGTLIAWLDDGQFISIWALNGSRLDATGHAFSDETF